MNEQRPNAGSSCLSCGKSIPKLAKRCSACQKLHRAEYCRAQAKQYYRDHAAEICAKKKASRAPRHCQDCGRGIRNNKRCAACFKKHKALTAVRAPLERRRVYTTKWRAKNTDAFREMCASWWRRNKVKNRLYKYRRRASVVGPGLSPLAWVEALRATGNTCFYCSEASKELTVDHVVPLSRGGEDSPANIVPACRSCNSSKGAKDAVSWYTERFGT
jgi:5-methylcytosine-specific restriction endonuclease McrA